MIIEKIFEQIGLTTADAKIYESLLHMKYATPSTIAKSSNVSRENVYYILKKLVDLGLVVQLPGVKKLTYRISQPENLTRLFEAKEQEFSNSKPLLVEVINLVNKQLIENLHVPTVRYYENITGIQKAYYDFLTGEKDSEILGITNYNWPKQLEQFFVTERIKTKVSLKLLIVKTEQALRYRRTNPRELRVTRIMPGLDFPTGTYLAVIANKVLIVNRVDKSDTEGVGIVIEHPAISKAFRSMFSMIWSTSKEFVNT